MRGEPGAVTVPNPGNMGGYRKDTPAPRTTNTSTTNDPDPTKTPLLCADHPATIRTPRAGLICMGGGPVSSRSDVKFRATA